MNPKVNESASKDLVAAFWNESLESAWKKMKLLDCRHLPVVNERGDLVGLLSDRDVQRAMTMPDPSVAGRFPQPEIPDDAFVSAYMTSNVVTVGRNASLAQASQLMIDNKISALVVVDGNAVVGIVTTEDLLKAFVSTLENAKHPVTKRLDLAGVETTIGTISHLLAQAGV